MAGMAAVVEALNKADGFMKAGDFEESHKLLKTLWDTKDKDPTIENFESAIVAWYAESLFACGKHFEALGPAHRAVEICRLNKDNNGVFETLSNLMEIYRYRGEIEKAADVAKEISDHLASQGDETLSKAFLKNSEAIRAKEPKTRVVVLVDDVRIELEELPQHKSKLTGKIEFRFCRNRPTLKGSTFKVDKGKELFINRDFAGALEQFKEAKRIDGFNPAATYEEGFSHLFLKQYAEGLQSFQLTNTIAPGWSNVNHAIWLTTMLIDGKIDHQTFQLIKVTEDFRVDPKKKADLCEHFFNQSPLTAPRAVLHLHFGQALQLLNDHERALQSFNSGLSQESVDSDTRTRLLFAAASSVETVQQKNELLDKAIQENGNMLASAMATVTKLIS